MQQRRSRRTRPVIVSRLEELAVQGHQPKEIHRLLLEEFGEDSISIRTVKDIRKETLDGRDPANDWSPHGKEPADVALVLPVLAAVIASTSGRVRTLTNEEADWIARISRWASDTPAWTCYRLAVRFAAATSKGDDTRPLEEYLAFAPWRDQRPYRTAAAYGWITDALLDDHVPDGQATQSVLWGPGQRVGTANRIADPERLWPANYLRLDRS